MASGRGWRLEAPAPNASRRVMLAPLALSAGRPDCAFKARGRQREARRKNQAGHRGVTLIFYEMGEPSLFEILCPF
jgi:hypothetical protein